MSAEVRPWDPFLMRIGENGLLKPARPRTRADIIDAPYHQTSFIAVGWFLKNTIQIKVLCSRPWTASYRCPQGYEFLSKYHLEDAFSARAWTKSDIGPGAGLSVYREYSPKTDPASAVSGRDSSARVR